MLYFLGDFNIDLPEANNPNARKLVHLCGLHCLTQLITEPTHGSALLDHIYVRNPCLNTCSGTLAVSYSDHILVYANLKMGKNCKVDEGRHACVTRYCFSELDIGALGCEVSDLLYGCYDEICDPESCCNHFITVLSSCTARLLRTQQMRCRRRYSVSWINRDYKLIARNRDYYFALYKKRGSLEAYNVYKCYRNKANNLAKHLKKSAVRQHIDSARDSKQFWRRLGPLVANKVNKNSNSTHLSCEDFANFFSESIENLVKDRGTLSGRLGSESAGLNSSCFSFQHVTDYDVCRLLRKLKLSYTFDINGLCSFVLKSLGNVIAPFLALLFNHCIDHAVFPDALKYATITPVHKGGNVEIPSNFRPISVLPNLSKLFECILNEQIVSYFNLHNFISPRQSGFRRMHSCESVLLYASDLILSSFDAGSNVLAMFFDLSKAFDVLDHSLLIAKVGSYGCDSAALSLLSSYLSGRRFSVKLGKDLSLPRGLHFGVPQGSILGPFLFLIYVNDMFSAMNDLELSSFADDTVLLFPYKDVGRVDNFCLQVSKVLSWFKLNGLFANANKCKVINFYLRKNLLLGQDSLTIDGIQYAISYKVKYLGIWFDSNMAFTCHYDVTHKRLAFYIRVFNRLSKLLDRSTLSKVFVCYIMPVILYGSLSYIHASLTHYSRICATYNRLVAFTELEPRHFNLGERLFINASRLVTKLIRRQCPSYLQSPQVSHSLATRCKYILPRVRTSSCRHSYKFWSVFIANRLCKRERAASHNNVWVKDFMLVCHFMRV